MQPSYRRQYRKSDTEDLTIIGNLRNAVIERDALIKEFLRIYGMVPEIQEIIENLGLGIDLAEYATPLDKDEE